MHRVAITVSMVLRTVTPRRRQRPVILRRLNRDFRSAQLHHVERCQHFPGVLKSVSSAKPCRTSRQDQVTDRQRFVAKQTIDFSVCGVMVPLK